MGGRGGVKSQHREDDAKQHNRDVMLLVCTTFISWTIDTVQCNTYTYVLWAIFSVLRCENLKIHEYSYASVKRNHCCKKHFPTLLEKLRRESRSRRQRGLQDVGFIAIPRYCLYTQNIAWVRLRVYLLLLPRLGGVLSTFVYQRKTNYACAYDQLVMFLFTW
jgi:hypothetical protein